MSYADITRTAVLQAMEEYDRLGADRFLDVHGFGLSTRYVLRHDGREYASKAIVGVAHGYARPDLGPLASSEFSGGVSGAARVLLDLGFDVVGTTAVSTRSPLPPETRAVVDGRRGEAEVVLVGCVKLKAAFALPAEDLYVSPLFKRRRAFAERAQRWFILSALHGLVRPEQVLEPYDMALADQSRAYRQEWGLRVVDTLRAELGSLTGRPSTSTQARRTPTRSSPSLRMRARS